MIKKYGLGMLAVILAVVASSFTVIEKFNPSQASYVFRYSGDYSAGSVQTLSNWAYFQPGGLCGGQDEKACRIAVSSAYVDNPSTTPTLKSTFVITANPTGATRYVSNISGLGSPNVISNQVE